MAFLSSSRYAKQSTVTVELADGRTVKALTLRRLPTTSGEAVTVEENDRLDLMANRRYRDPTRFWHIADANRELEANRLTAEAGSEIDVPES